MRVDSVTSTTGTARLSAFGSIIDALDDSAADVTGVSIELTSTAGGIGTSAKPLDANNGTGRFTVTAAEPIFISETTGDMRVGRIQSGKSVSLVAIAGSIVDGTADSFVKVSGTDISLTASAGIGAVSDDLEIDTMGGGRLSATAGTSVFITEKIGALRVTGVSAGTGALWLSVAESSATGDDFVLEAGKSITAGGDISILAGDDVTIEAGASVTAGTGKSIAITADRPSLDPAGATVTLAGSLSAAAVTVTAFGQGSILISNLDGNQVLTATQLSRTPAATGSATQVITLSGIAQVNLVGGTSDNTFTFGEWKGIVSVDGGTGFDTVRVTSDTDFTIADALIKRVGFGDASITGIENGVFRGGAKANKFDVSGWTKSGNIDAAAAPSRQVDSIISTVNGSMEVVNNSSGTILRRTGAVDLVLAGFESAEFTGGSGDDLFDVSGWTGAGKITGGLGNDTIRSSNDADMMLSDIAMTRIAGRTSLGSLTLAGLENAELAGGASVNKFALSNWTGNAAVTGGTGDTVALTGSGNFVIGAGGVTLSGKTISLSGIPSLAITGGASTDLFTINGWAGSLSLAGGGGNDTVAWTGSGDVSLTASTLMAGGATTTLSAIANAQISLDDNANTVTINGWSGGGTINAGGGNDKIAVISSGAVTLSDSSLSVSTKTIAISGFEDASITGTAATQQFTVSGWTRKGTIFGGGGADRLVDAGAGTFTLEGSTYTRPNGTAFTVSGAGPLLTGSSGNDSFVIRNWSASAGSLISINGVSGSDSVTIEADANFTYTASGSGGTLAVGTASVNLTSTAAIGSLSLKGGSGANAFNLTGWTKGVSIDGAGGVDSLAHTADTDFLLTASQLTIGKGGAVMVFGVASIESVRLTGGASANIFNVNGFGGALTLDGGAGSDTYNLQLPNDLTLAWAINDSGRSGTDVLNAKGANSAPVSVPATRKITYGSVEVTYTGIERVNPPERGSF
jgi:hypothetical protein